MKEYCNKIEIYLLDEISLIEGTTITMVESNLPISIDSSNDIIPNEQQSEKDGVVYYTQNMNVFSDKVTADQLKNLLDRKVVVKLFYTDDVEVLLGSIDNPARCKAAPYLEQDSINFSSESPFPMLS